MDIILDTGHLADFLAQYFDSDLANRGGGKFQPKNLISAEAARRLNNIMTLSRMGTKDLVIASAFAFIEIARKWSSLAAGRFTVDQLHAFIYQPPTWFSIAPVDSHLLPSFIDVPTHVNIESKIESIEWTDAIHIATVISRGGLSTDATLATTDHKLKAILETQKRLIL